MVEIADQIVDHLDTEGPHLVLKRFDSELVVSHHRQNGNGENYWFSITSPDTKTRRTHLHYQPPDDLTVLPLEVEATLEAEGYTVTNTSDTGSLLTDLETISADNPIPAETIVAILEIANDFPGTIETYTDILVRAQGRLLKGLAEGIELRLLEEATDGEVWDTLDQLCDVLSGKTGNAIDSLATVSDEQWTSIIEAVYNQHPGARNYVTSRLEDIPDPADPYFVALE
ncbi:hypothetical protein RYH80_18415 [Halobaculum sp. MBLA0147]|uniref:hypothetical protein n=1 Tax=Halobaculum sp. MBLA0147 TaxID=3079934 RepID=UPI0035265D33